MSKKILNYSLFFLFSFFFTGLQPSTSAVVHKKECVVHQGITCLLSENLFNGAHTPLHSPFQSLPTENEQEPSGEEEVKDNSDNARHLYVLKNLCNRVFNDSGIVKSHFHQRIESIENRLTVPLFILFLSWKSFLV